MKKIARGKHNLFQKIFLDPVVALIVGFFLLIFWILPLPIARQLGRSLGRLVGLCCRRRSRWAMFNLDIAFPKKSKKEKKKIIQKMWVHFGQMAAELPHLKKIIHQAHFNGLEHIQKAYHLGRGGFVCSAHFGNWELPFGPWVAPDFVPNPVFRKANNWFLDELLFERRGGVKIPKGSAGARVMIDLLKHGKFISILCDQKFREGTAIPFWGMPALTPTAMATLAIKMKLPVIMVKSVYKKNRYEITFYPPVKFPKQTNPKEAEYAFMLSVNQMYERWFAENPEQVLWIHRRFNKHIYPN